MIIKNFLNKIYISKYFLLVVFLCLITGLIKELTIIIILIIFHEFGHYFISVLFNWNIKRIDIYPFGGLIIYDEIIDKPLKEELLITIFGPISQCFIFLFGTILYKNCIISDYYYHSFVNYHYSMLVFNILPIIPLDGSKIINILLNKIFNYRISYILLIIISIIFLIVFIIIFKNNYSYLMVISFLIYELIMYFKNKNIMFNRFIFEKYLYKNNYRKYLKVDNIKNMKRNKKHFIKYNNTYILEKEYIKKIKGV